MSEDKKLEKAIIEGVYFHRDMVVGLHNWDPEYIIKDQEENDYDRAMLSLSILQVLTGTNRSLQQNKQFLKNCGFSEKTINFVFESDGDEWGTY